VVGALFRKQKQTTVKSELVILLRPVVVASADPWTDDLERTRQRLRAIGGDRGGFRDVVPTRAAQP